MPVVMEGFPKEFPNCIFMEGFDSTMQSLDVENAWHDPTWLWQCMAGQCSAVQRSAIAGQRSALTLDSTTH